MRLLVLALAASTAAQRGRSRRQNPRDSKFVINAAKDAKDAFAVNDGMAEAHPDGDQQLLKMLRLGPLGAAANWVDESGSYLRSLATFRFAAADAGGVAALAANASLPPVFGVDVVATRGDARALCAFLTVAAPALERSPAVRRYVLSTVGAAGSPWGLGGFDAACPGGLAAAAKLLGGRGKLRRWYASGHAPNADLGDKPPGGSMSAWDPASAGAYAWPRDAGRPQKYGGYPQLRLVPRGLSSDLLGLANLGDLETLAAAAAASDAPRPALLSTADAAGAPAAAATTPPRSASTSRSASPRANSFSTSASAQGRASLASSSEPEDDDRACESSAFADATTSRSPATLTGASQRSKDAKSLATWSSRNNAPAPISRRRNRRAPVAPVSKRWKTVAASWSRPSGAVAASLNVCAALSTKWPSSSNGSAAAGPSSPAVSGTKRRSTRCRIASR